MSGNSEHPPSPPRRRRSTRSIATDSSSWRDSAVDVGLSSPPPSPPRAAAAVPIDVEVVDDDEIQLLSSSRGFPQPRNQTRRRNRPVIVVADEEREISSEPSATRPCPNFSHKRQKIQQKSTVFNCESTSEDRRASIPEPKEVSPKEATFSCPICMGTLVNPCSTVCGHIFCESCLKAAVQVQKKCPTCRTKLTNKSFHRVFLPVTTKD